MVGSRKKLLMLVCIFFVSFAIAAVDLFHLNAVSESSATAHQYHLQDTQAELRDQKPNNSAIAQAPVSIPTVTIRNYRFNPDNVVIQKGGQVTFINRDSDSHTVTPRTGAQFEGTGLLGRNKSKTVVFNTVGVQNYFCEPHPYMQGEITVAE